MKRQLQDISHYVILVGSSSKMEESDLWTGEDGFIYYYSRPVLDSRLFPPQKLMEDAFKEAEEKKKRKSLMSTKINWKDSKPAPRTFASIEVGDAFTIDTVHSKGAVYIKVDLIEVLTSIRNNTYGAANFNVAGNRYAMQEVATGKVFAPTPSPIKPVEVEISVNQAKPSIY